MKKLIFSLFMIIHFVQAADTQQLTISWGVSGRQGRRPEMEDAHAVVMNFDGSPQEAFFAIYDGYSGKQAAQAASKGLETSKGQIPALHELIQNESIEGEDRYVQAFKKMDSTLSDCDVDSGTTAVIAHIIKNQGLWKLFLAWAGDSRAVLATRDGTIAEVTRDHKPNDPDEKKRIEDAGGSVDLDLSGISRVSGLSVSRAIGGKSFKEKTPQVIATPEVKEINLDQKHKFLILASDGFWDKVDNTKAVDLLKEVSFEKQVTYRPAEMKIEDGNCQLIRRARLLRDYAYDKMSDDNISVLIARLDWSSKK